MKSFLSVVMPVYNEKNTILKIIDKVLQLEAVMELIIVDDGSKDGTIDVLKGMKANDRIRVYFHEKNMGKGAALRTGFKQAKANIVAVQDADMEYDPAELPVLAQPILDGFADVVYGSRLSGGKPQRVYMFWHKIGNSVISFTANILFNSTLSDIETCYKLFKREVIQSIDIKSKGFEVEPELTAKVLKKTGLRIYEVPISYYGRTYQEGKKITWRHGFGALWTLLKYRFID